eukprot:CAMPEP_0168555996 /NCGR_PEP_ID=MMETSP0413-20121227/8643_1 /TAXON_ID=136452 /ORGANISM="Filamoeba nolandi, Strain NC-AS-23-1" /LENGTH=232 /DNA_ID=CAMNT_0008586905 /DNA_START=45 /DNA_END=743 /DNA_ORIENTATION=+
MELGAAPILAEGPITNVKQAKFEPYVNNGGTVIAVAGKNFAVIGADTRLSEGYSINSRHVSKVIKLTSKCVLASSGMQADITTLHKMLKTKLVQYQHQNGKEMPTTAIAQLLAITLYYKRFFPYYTFNVLGGIDDNGVGCAYSYDAVGSFERVQYSSSGTGQSLVQPLLDNQVAKKHQKIVQSELTREECEAIVKDAFNSAGERDIYTGDHVQLLTITVDGVTETVFDLKYD